MYKKYRFKLNGSEMFFDKKNDFINFCQKKYNESVNGNLTSPASYSFDDGETWNDISLFKHYRQDIQNEKVVKPNRQNISNKPEEGSNWFSYLVVIALIVGGVYYYNDHNSSNISLDETTQESENNDQLITEENSDEANEDDFVNSVSVTDWAKNIYNESPFIKAINASEDEKKWILAILSDPNPNPSFQEGNSCSQSDYSCDYCSNYIPAKLFTLQSKLRDMVSPLSTIGFGSGAGSGEYNWAAIVNQKAESGSLFEGAGTEKIQEGYRIVQAIINEYKRGERYTCLAVPKQESGKDFCSEKCKTEYRYSR